MSRTLTIIGGMILAVLIISCDRDARAREAILGTWVSANQMDTLVFLNEEHFEKSSPADGFMTPYLYSIRRDSITVQYNGPNYILVKPTAHCFEVDDISLFIDFGNGCYGFPKEKVYYSR